VPRGFISAVRAYEFAQFVRQQRTDAAPSARGDNARLLEERWLDRYGNVLFCSYEITSGSVSRKIRESGDLVNRL
jgi:hypothetical protein